MRLVLAPSCPMTRRAPRCIWAGPIDGAHVESWCPHGGGASSDSRRGYPRLGGGIVISIGDWPSDPWARSLGEWCPDAPRSPRVGITFVTRVPQSRRCVRSRTPIASSSWRLADAKPTRLPPRDAWSLRRDVRPPRVSTPARTPRRDAERALPDALVPLASQ
jgi:hypothetical protein